MYQYTETFYCGIICNETLKRLPFLELFRTETETFSYEIISNRKTETPYNRGIISHRNTETFYAAESLIHLHTFPNMSHEL